jgi:hypothetical protein
LERQLIRTLGLVIGLSLTGAAGAEPRRGGDGALGWQIDVDPRIAAAAPDFAAFLRTSDDALIVEMLDGATRERADLGAGFHQHSLMVTTEARAITPGLVSALRSVSSFSGGAHGNLFLDPLTWDRKTGDFVRLDHFLSEDAAGWKALQSIARILRADLSAREGLWVDGIAMAAVPDPAALQSFTLEPSTTHGRIGGLAFHFAPYELGPCSAGPQRAVVPQAAFRSGLKPQFRALFDGAPAD